MIHVCGAAGTTRRVKGAVMPTDPANIRTAIVLQGGGALGAYELGVLKAIYDQRPGFKPAAVAGISIGAVTAAVLGGARGEPIPTLEPLWRDKLTVLHW